jgi:hypothetical protein
MKKMFAVIVIGIFFAVVTGLAIAGEKAPQKVIDLAKGKLAKYGADPVIVEAVKAENAKRKTLDQIKDMDKKWMATSGVAPFMKELQDNKCGKHLRDIKKSEAYFMEIFVMDNLGANVCMSDKTSDYWQGDEPKFTESYKGGTGAIHIPEIKFDDSSQAYIVQVSVPVMEGGKAIGAITFGVDPNKVK